VLKEDQKFTRIHTYLHIRIRTVLPCVAVCCSVLFQSMSMLSCSVCCSSMCSSTYLHIRIRTTSFPVEIFIFFEKHRERVMFVCHVTHVINATNENRDMSCHVGMDESCHIPTNLHGRRVMCCDVRPHVHDLKKKKLVFQML